MVLSLNVSWDSCQESTEIVNRSTIRYMEELDSELSIMPGYKEPEDEEIKKECLKSSTDPDLVIFIKNVKRTWIPY